MGDHSVINSLRTKKVSRNPSDFICGKMASTLMYAVALITLGISSVLANAGGNTCYECHSAYSGSGVQPACSGNGTIDESIHPARPCSTFCYTRVDRYHAGA